MRGPHRVLVPVVSMSDDAVPGRGFFQRFADMQGTASPHPCFDTGLSHREFLRGNPQMVKSISGTSIPERRPAKSSLPSANKCPSWRLPVGLFLQRSIRTMVGEPVVGYSFADMEHETGTGDRPSRVRPCGVHQIRRVRLPTPASATRVDDDRCAASLGPFGRSPSTAEWACVAITGARPAGWARLT
jgi:hypothetical protein